MVKLEEDGLLWEVVGRDADPDAVEHHATILNGLSRVELNQLLETERLAENSLQPDDVVRVRLIANALGIRDSVKTIIQSPQTQ